MSMKNSNDSIGNRTRDLRVCSTVLSVVGISIRYGLEGRGIESQWGRNFPHPSRPDSYTMDTGSFPGVKLPDRDVDHPISSRDEVKDRTELYFYSFSRPSWPVLS
jgi:hypothetical protein